MIVKMSTPKSDQDDVSHIIVLKLRIPRILSNTIDTSTMLAMVYDIENLKTLKRLKQEARCRIRMP